jgi:dTDP-4-dehydrorhamnose reductase
VAWLFGDRKDFIARLLQGHADIVRVAHDQIGSPTPIFSVAKTLLKLAERMAAAMSPPKSSSGRLAAGVACPLGCRGI